MMQLFRMRTPMLQMCLRQGFGLTDFFSDRNQKNSEYEFKKEMNFMANKPTFTIMDYKQRILSEYKKAKDKPTAKLQAKEQYYVLYLEKDLKILNCLFEYYLNGKNEVKREEKQEIESLTNIPISRINTLFGKVYNYMLTHKTVRNLKLRNKPLPANDRYLKKLMANSDSTPETKKTKYYKYRKISRRQRYRYLKFDIYYK